MNFYKLFYWISIAEKLQNFVLFCAVFSSIIFVIGMIVSVACRTLVVGGTAVNRNTGYGNIYRKVAKRAFIALLFFWMLYIFIPSKSDTILIIAGGAVGNFVTRDSSTQQIPSEVMLFLREKIKAEINEAKLSNVIPQADTLKDKTKEELIELLNKKKE